MAVATPPTVSRGNIGELLELPVDLIDVADNVRVDPGELQELADSIKAVGVEQPVKAVGPHADGRYRLVYGQRRLLASRLAGRSTIPAIVEASSEADERGVARTVAQLVENLHRADLNPIEEAIALREVLAAAPKLTQADLARRIGRSAPWVANTLGLLESPAPIQEAIRTGKLSAGHAKALKGLAPKTQEELGKKAIAEDWSAHRTESGVQDFKRSEEWRKEREALERKNSEARRSQQLAAIANFEKKKVAKDDPIYVARGYYNNGADGHIAELIRKAGYIKVITGQAVNARPVGVECDCRVWKVEVNYDQRVSLAPGCINQDHQVAKTRVDEDKRQAQYALQARVQARLAADIPPAVVAQPLPAFAARMALFIVLEWRAGDWAVKRGGKRSDPWTTIATLDEGELSSELGQAIAAGFRDSSGYRLPWPALAEQLGLADAPKPEPAPKAKRPKAAAAEPAE